MAPPLLHLPARLKTLQTGAGRGRRWRCCWKWRDQKPHPGKVIERRKIPNDYEYYVHYTEFNRRLDERVKLEQLDLGTMETDLYEEEDKVTSLKMTRHQKRKIDETHVEHGDEELDAASLQEHEEFTKVKNIAKIELGRYKIDTCVNVTLSILQVMRYTEVDPFLCLRLPHGWLFLKAYELSKEEGKVGTPERPLSDLGLLSYRGYWTRVLLDIFKKHKGNISIKELSDMTAIKPDDILSTLQNLDLIQYRKGQHVICADLKVLDRRLNVEVWKLMLVN